MGGRELQAVAVEDRYAELCAEVEKHDGKELKGTCREVEPGYTL